MSVFSLSVQLKCPPAALRAFVGKPANLPQISDPEMELEIIRAPEFVTVGQKIEFRITAYGFKQRATHIYTLADSLIIEERQVEGPLRSWRHRQSLIQIDDLNTELIDEIEFEPPGGMLGFMMTESRIRDSLDEGLTIRHELLEDLIRRGVIQ